MDAVLKKSLDAIESSLALLLESVSADDPSTDYAAALVAADDEFSASLEQLVTHQTNHQRLLHLRALSSALDSELSTLLTTLSQARTELQATTTTIFPSHSRDVEYNALLTYATKISKFTRPPTQIRQQAAQQAADAASTEPSTALVVKSATNGNDAGKEGGSAGTSGAETTGNAATRPTAEDIALLDPTAGMPFAPWPSEDVMKRGVLAHIGYMEAVPEAAPAGEADGGLPGPEPTVQAPSGDRHMADADKERPREDVPRREPEQKKEQVFQGLDLYDPDSD